MSPLSRAMPLLADLKRTGGSTLGQDALAGTITAILLIPQALAYALLAGLPPEAGLYASVLPPIVYAFLGSSRTLAVGPVAVAAVMVSTALIAYAGDDASKYFTGSLILSALTGAILLVLAILRMGWLTHFISHPVLSGFTTGAAIYIIGTQLSPLTGVPVARDSGFAEIIRELFSRLGEFSPVTLVFSIISLSALIAARQPLKRVLVARGMGETLAATVCRMAPLALVVLTTLVSALLNLSERSNLSVVGSIPSGLPGIDLSFLAAPGWLILLPSAGMIALIAYVESISVARALAFRRREKIDPDRELMSLGVTNVAGACVGAMPVAGGFSRSMVNFEAGAQTQAAAVITALWVGLGALFFAGLLSDLPKAVLAAIIVVAVFQLIDFESLRRTWSYSRNDGLAQAATILGVLLLGIEHGLMLGAVLGALSFLYITSRPHIAAVGRVGDSEHYRNIHRYKVTTWPELLLLRVDENLYFANTPRVESELMDRVIESEAVQHVVLILSGVAHIDASSLEMLEEFEESLADKGITMNLAEVKGPVMDRLKGTELLKRLGDARVFLSTEAAVQALKKAQA